MSKKIVESKPLSANLQYLKDKDNEPVKGIFRNYETPGADIKFLYRAHKGPIEHVHVKDGEICSITLGQARHLNKNGWYAINAWALDEKGNPRIDIGKKVRRFGFQSLEFVDIDDITPVGLSPQQMISNELRERQENTLIL